MSEPPPFDPLDHVDERLRPTLLEAAMVRAILARWAQDRGPVPLGDLEADELDRRAWAAVEALRPWTSSITGRREEGDGAAGT